MKRTFTYSVMILIGVMISFGFSYRTQEGKVHLKVTKEENGEKTVFEKVYANMEALKADEELRAFDVMVENWTEKSNHLHIHAGEEGEKKIIIKKKTTGDEQFTWVSEDEENHDGEKHVIIRKKGAGDEHIEVEGKKVIKIKTDGKEKVFTITSDGEGEHNMVWIDEDGNQTELTEENIRKMAEDGEKVEIHKKIEVITSDDDKGKNVFIMKGDVDGEMEWVDEDGNVTKLTEEKIAELKEIHSSGEGHKKVEVIVSDDSDEEKKVIVVKKLDDDDEEAEIEVSIEKEIDEDGNEVIKDKKVWIKKDGEKVELDAENSFEFKTEGDQVTVIVDEKTIEEADFTGGKMEGNAFFIKTKDHTDGDVQQTMNVNIEEKDGEKYIEIDIKRTSSMSVTISEINKNDASLSDAKVDLRNNLKPSQLSYYPNPSDGKFNLSFSLKQNDDVLIKVTDILGNEVYSEKMIGFEGIYDNEINLVGKQKGIYILQVSQKKKMLTRKILIE